LPSCEVDHHFIPPELLIAAWRIENPHMANAINTCSMLRSAASFCLSLKSQKLPTATDEDQDTRLLWPIGAMPAFGPDAVRAGS
jgi:hypothetical protein